MLHFLHVHLDCSKGKALGANEWDLSRRYIQKFYSMRTQLQAISLRIQTVRSNEQMAQSMKGATSLLGSMNRSMNLPALQRIAMEFEKENDIMDQRQEMMDDAIDDVTGLEDEEEGEEVVKEVLDEIGVDLGQAVGLLLALRFGEGEQWREECCADCVEFRWARRLQEYRRALFRMGGWQKPLVEGLGVGVGVVMVVEAEGLMMIYRRDWIVYGGSNEPGGMNGMILRTKMCS